MKKLFVFIAFLFAVVCYAAPPPEQTPVPESLKIFTVVDNHVDCQILTTYLFQNVTYSQLNKVELINTITPGEKPFVFSREVDRRPKDSNFSAVTSTETSFAELTALRTTTTYIESILKHPPTLCTRKGNYNKSNFEINLQHSNYAYPFGANEQIFYS